MNNWTCSKCKTSQSSVNLVCITCGQNMAFDISEKYRQEELEKAINLEVKRKKNIKLANVVFVASILIALILYILKGQNIYLYYCAIPIYLFIRYIRKNSRPLVEHYESNVDTTELELVSNESINLYSEKNSKNIIV